MEVANQEKEILTQVGINPTGLNYRYLPLKQEDHLKLPPLHNGE